MVLDRLPYGQRALDHVIHIVVPILRQPPAEDGIGLVLGEGCVLLVELLVAVVVDRVIRFFAAVPVGRIFTRDVGDGLRAELEMLVLDDAGVRDFALRVVDDGDTLMILLLQALRLEVQAAVLELAELVIEILVNRARVDDLSGHGLIGGALLEVIHTRADLNAVEQSLDQLRVAADRDALIAVVEIVVVERVADRQALDDESWQFRATAAPLLLRVALDELRVDVRADERDGLLLEVLRLALDGLALLRNDGLRLRWRHDVPELAERVHVERQVVEMALIIRDR